MTDPPRRSLRRLWSGFELLTSTFQHPDFRWARPCQSRRSPGVEKMKVPDSASGVPDRRHGCTRSRKSKKYSNLMSWSGDIHDDIFGLSTICSTREAESASRATACRKTAADPAVACYGVTGTAGLTGRECYFARMGTLSPLLRTLSPHAAFAALTPRMMRSTLHRGARAA